MKYRLMFDEGYEDFDSLSTLMLKYPRAKETARIDNIYYFE